MKPELDVPAYVEVAQPSLVLCQWNGGSHAFVRPLPFSRVPFHQCPSGIHLARALPAIFYRLSPTRAGTVRGAETGAREQPLTATLSLQTQRNLCRL